MIYSLTVVIYFLASFEVLWKRAIQWSVAQCRRDSVGPVRWIALPTRCELCLCS